MNTLTDDIDLATERRIRDVLRDYGRLNKNVDELDADTDLYQSGMTSHASVNVMLGLESNFDVEFPDHMLKRSVFASIGAIRQALAQLVAS
jgi:acyl carrier protein